MNDSITVKVVVEGQTEQNFIKEILAPYCALKRIYMTPSLVSKKGQKGGDVKFQRVEQDIVAYLKQPNVSAVSTFVDYYGLKAWPEKDSIPPHSTPQQIADRLNNAAKAYICARHDRLNPQNRFIPFMAVHEFETLLFSDSRILAEALNIEQREVDNVLSECGSPEQINNSPQTAPSKRLLAWTNDQYKKIIDGIKISEKIGIDKMRQECPLFHAWLTSLEQLQEQQ